MRPAGRSAHEHRGPPGRRLSAQPASLLASSCEPPNGRFGPLRFRSELDPYAFARRSAFGWYGPELSGNLNTGRRVRGPMVDDRVSWPDVTERKRLTMIITDRCGRSYKDCLRTAPCLEHERIAPHINRSDQSSAGARLCVHPGRHRQHEYAQQCCTTREKWQAHHRERGHFRLLESGRSREQAIKFDRSLDAPPATVTHAYGVILPRG